MIRTWLALLQFPLLYTFAIFIGAGVYGASAEGTGLVYLAPYLVLALAAPRRAGRAVAVAPPVARAVLLLGAIAAGIGYASLHLRAWDERSSIQTLWMAAVGLLSLAGALLGPGSLEPGGPRGRGLGPALGLMTPFFLLAAAYPLAPLFGVGVALAAAATAPARPRRETASPPPARADGVAEGMVLVAAADVARAVWDFGVTSAWALHLATAIAVAAVATAIAPRAPAWGTRAALVLGAGNVVALALAPAYVLSPVHAMVAGLALGVALERTVRARPGAHGVLVAVIGWRIFWGLALSYALGRLPTVAATGPLMLGVPGLALARRAARGPARRRVAVRGVPSAEC